MKKMNSNGGGPLAPGSHELATPDGARLAYHVHGIHDGPVLVAIPGGPGFSHQYLRAPLLEARVKVVYVDLIGTGASSRLDPPTKYSRVRDVADLELLRKHLGLERMSLLGHSAGGFVAQEYAIAHPAKVDRLVLADTTPTNGPEFDASMAEQMAARSSRPWFANAASALKTMFTQRLGEAEALEVGKKMIPLYLYDAEGNPRLVDAFAGRFEFNVVRLQQAPPVPFDHRAALSKLDVKALVIVGVEDFICAPKLAKHLHDALRGSRMVTLQRSGHMGHLEEPEVFAVTVASFLAE